MRPTKYTDKRLALILIVLVSIDVVLCSFWSGLLQPSVQKIVPVTGPGTLDGQLWQNINFLDCYWGPTPTGMNIFFGLEGAYKLAMVFYGLYLSLLLWKYGSSMWVESKQIIFCMYNMIIFALIGLALQLTLNQSTDLPTRSVLFVTRSMCIFLSGVITIGTILLPRLMDPQAKAHEGKDTTGAKKTIDTTAVQLNDLEWKFEILEKKYKDLKQKFRERYPDEPLSEDK